MNQSYSKYIDVKLQWFGSIPSSWSLISFKHLLQKVYGGGTPNTSIDENWGEGDDLSCIPWIAISDITKSEGVLLETSKRITEKGRLEKGLETLPKGTLLMSIFASLGKTTRLGIEATVNQAILGLVPSPKLNIDFLEYLLMDAERYISYYSSASTQENLNLTKIKNLQFPVPSLEEQTKIAQYLDHQTAIIDKLIQQKEKLIELLKEKRQSVINEAVTKGLNPNTKMKDSGIEWLGEVPENWKVLKFRYLIDVLTDFTANGSFADLAKNVTYLDEGYSRLIRLTDLRENLMNDGIYVSEESHNYLTKSSLYGHEVLLANVGAYAGLAWKVPILTEPSTLGPNMFLLKFYNDLNNDFAYFSLISEYLSSQLKMKAISSAQPKLNKEDVRSCLFVLPTLEEQNQIVEYLLNVNQKFDDVLLQEAKLIDKLKEYRQSIISEAVTGKIDVRDWQPNKQQVA